jgi:zinc protease
VSSFAAGMLTKGTKKKDALAIAKAVDHIGGAIGATASYEATLVSCSALAKDLGTCTSLLAEVTTQPSFPKGEMAKVREAMMAELRQRLDSAELLAGAHFQNLLWGDDNPRGRVVSEESVQSISRDALVKWHKRWFHPNNAMLAIAGDVDVAKVKAELKKRFGTWKKGKLPARATQTDPVLDRVKIRLVDKPKQTETEIRVGQFGIAHDDNRFFETLVWNYALGGGAFASRLMKVIRAEHGKTYGATSTFDRNLEKGSFVVATSTRTSETVETIKLVIDEIAKMDKEGPTQAEVADAVANIAGSYAGRFESVNDLASALLTADLHGFGDEYLENYPVRVGKVDVASAKSAAKEILDTEHYVVVIVGDGAEIAPQLEKAGWYYEAVSFASPIGQPAVEMPKASPEDLKKAKKLLDDALAAKGKKITKLKSLRMEASGRLVAQKQALDVVITRSFKSPDKMRVDLQIKVKKKDKSTGTVDIAYALDGSTGWQLGADGALVDIPSSDVAILVQQRWHDPEFILTRHLEKGTIVNPLPDEKVDGKTYGVINLVSADGTATATLYIEKKTKLVVQMAYPEGGKVTVDVFGDYKEVDGVQIAHTRVSQSGDETAELQITKVELDPKLDDALFAKPKQ